MRNAANTLGFLVGVVLVLGGIAPASALAQRVWVEGTATQPFSVGSAESLRAGTLDGSPAMLLERRVFWQYSRTDVMLFDPFSAQSLANGDVLIADRTNVAVIEVNRRGQIVWSFTRADDPRLVNPYSAQRLDNGDTLVCDRRADFVIEVTPDKRVVWQYGAVPDSLAPGSVMDPYSATRLANGNTLICDNRYASRVLEVRTSDYDPAKPNLGYSANSIIWQYGRDNDPGTGPGQLASPRKAQRLPNGNTLITDSEDNEASGNRVLEVTPDGRIAWQAGGGSLLTLVKPSSAERLDNGNTLISEEDTGRVIEVTPGGAIADAYQPGDFLPEGGALSKVRDAQRTEAGLTIVADQTDKRVLEFGYLSSGTLTSADLSLGMPGVRKSIASISLVADEPDGTSVDLAYSLDGGAWVQGGRTIELPRGSTAARVRYRVKLRGSPGVSPVLRQVKIVYDVATTGGGSGTQTHSNRTSATTSNVTNQSEQASNGSGGSSPGTGSGTDAGAASGIGASGSATSGATSLEATGTAVATDSNEGAAGDLVSGSMRFASGMLMSDLGAPGARGGDLATGGSGGSPGAALALLGLCYLAGAGGASLAHSTRPLATALRALGKPFGRR